MKRVIATPAGAELELLRTILQEAGIPCFIRNEQLSELLGTTPFNAELWVESDDDLPKARELCDAWSATTSETAEIWTCTGCGQSLALQFDSCWQCGTRRPCAASPLAALLRRGVPPRRRNVLRARPHPAPGRLACRGDRWLQLPTAARRRRPQTCVALSILPNLL